MAQPIKYLHPVKVVSARFVSAREGVPQGSRYPTAAAKKGLAHEKALARFLENDPCVVIGPWVEYVTDAGVRGICQPDFLHFDIVNGRITVLEAKLSHCAAAYYQLVNLYAPLMQVMFPSWYVRVQEVVRWYDTFTPFPGGHVLRRRLLDAPPFPTVGVHIFRPETSRG